MFRSFRTALILAAALAGGLLAATLAFAMRCGDAIIDVEEECDDGELNGSDRPCLDNCRLATCGDGLVCSDLRCTTGAGGGPESCDDAGDSAQCSVLCVPHECGDAIVAYAAGEECDEGHANSDTVPDACRTDCTSARCGDGTVDSSEMCEPRGEPDGGLCSPYCLFPSSCGDVNGDGRLSVTDTLLVLTAAVGLADCDPCSCDPDCNRQITVRDALLILQASVGPLTELGCCVIDGCVEDEDCGPGGECAGAPGGCDLICLYGSTTTTLARRPH